MSKSIIIVHTINEVREIVKDWKSKNYSIGLVPTMGFLHEGHESLIKKSVNDNDKTVVSVFVNPIQFGPNEDYEAYPRNMVNDSNLCENAGADLIFNPEPSEMYEKDFNTHVAVSLLTEKLCGEKRPGHFNGVCTVVSKLFHIAKPDKAYFGQKDAQQLAVIKRMVNDLNFDIEIIGCTIIREADGLAKSSRNTYLSDDERQAALILSKALNNAKVLLDSGERICSVIKKSICDIISKEPLARIDYTEIVDSLNLQPVDKISSSVLCAIAVYIGKTRLIDNFTWEE